MKDVSYFIYDRKSVDHHAYDYISDILQTNNIIKTINCINDEDNLEHQQILINELKEYYEDDDYLNDFINNKNENFNDELFIFKCIKREN